MNAARLIRSAALTQRRFSAVLSMVHTLRPRRLLSTEQLDLLRQQRLIYSDYPTGEYCDTGIVTVAGTVTLKRFEQDVTSIRTVGYAGCVDSAQLQQQERGRERERERAACSRCSVNCGGAVATSRAKNERRRSS